METRTIVVDVDDTISTHTDRDYANAIPHPDMIGKLNEMKLAGWRIVLHTSRGMLSCAGDLDRIELERRPVLEDWLRRHGVLYDELVFGKPLALYYVDDKAIRPDEFIRMPFWDLGGGSGARVERFGDRVMKWADNAHDQVVWYREAERLRFPVPRVLSYYGNCLTMEHVDGWKMSEICPSQALDRLMGIVSAESNFQRTDPADWSTMVERVKAHAALNDFPRSDEIIPFLEGGYVTRRMNALSSFCHGDLTLENVIMDRTGETILIDPNSPPGLFSSWILDVGKIFQSLHYGYEQLIRGEQPLPDREKRYREAVGLLTEEEVWLGHVAEMVHYIRMLRYRPESQRPLIGSIIETIWLRDINHVS